MYLYSTHPIEFCITELGSLAPGNEPIKRAATDSHIVQQLSEVLEILIRNDKKGSYPDVTIMTILMIICFRR